MKTIKQLEAVVTSLQELQDRQLTAYREHDMENTIFLLRADKVRERKSNVIAEYVRLRTAGGVEFDPEDSIKIISLAHRHCSDKDFLAVSKQLLGGKNG